MNKIITLILFSFFFNFYQSFGQINPHVPVEGLANADLSKELTIKLTNGLSNDSLKLLAIYNWIVENISYDSLLYKQIQNPLHWRKQVASKAIIDIKPIYDCAEILNTKKTICLGYAHLFSSMCNVAGIQNAIIKGYGRIDSVAVNAPNHAWVAFKLSDKWYLADPTWDSNIYASGYERSDKREHLFLMTDPDIFLTSHLPLDPLWQFRTPVLPLKDWNAFTDNTSPADAHFNFTDSLKHYENSTIEKKFLGSINRIIQAKEHAFIGHSEYCGFLFKPMTEEIINYANLNKQLNTGNRNIEEMARKILPRKKELFDRLSRIESYIRKYNYHFSKLAQMPVPYKDLFSVSSKDISNELAEIKKYSNYLAQERNSLEATIKELEPYQKKTQAKK